MAPIVRAEPNGFQALLIFDGAHSELEKCGWLPFIRKFNGYNPSVARQFALSFDGCRAKKLFINFMLHIPNLGSAAIEG